MVLNYLCQLTKEIFAIQFFHAIVSRTSRNKLARIHPPRGTSHWSATGNRPIYELELRGARSSCRISLKSHRPLHDCGVLREAVPPAGQNATTFSLIWHGTSSCRIEEPCSLLLLIYIFLSLFLLLSLRPHARARHRCGDSRRNVFHEDSLRGLEKRREDKAREKRSGRVKQLSLVSGF